MQNGDYALALYRVLKHLELVFFEDNAYCMNVINSVLHIDISEDTDESAAEDVFDANALLIGRKIAFGEPFVSDTDSIDRLCASVRAARELFPKDEDGFIKFSSSNNE